MTTAAADQQQPPWEDLNYIYWCTRLGQVEIASVCRSYDGFIGRLVDLEEKCKFIEEVAPCNGRSKLFPKGWSYNGAVRFNSFSEIPLVQECNGRHRRRGIRVFHGLDCSRDAGNYIYAIVMRSYGHCGVEWDWYFSQHYSDPLLGDILEAIMGIAWATRRGVYMGCQFHRQELEEFVMLIENAIVAVELINKYCIQCGYWMSSTEVADWLCHL